MALRQLVLSKKISTKKGELDNLREKAKELMTREKELETSLEEAATEEETQLVEEEIGKYEDDKKQNEEATERLEQEIKDLEAELEEENRKTKNPVKKPEERKESGGIMIKRGVFKGKTSEERDAFLARNDVKEFLQRARDMKEQQRAVGGADLLIPEVVLELVRDTIDQYSKLSKKVRLKSVGGKARQTIAGTIPEGVWTEAVGVLNELSINFNQVEVDGYKVGGYIPIENSTLEDASDVNLANEIIYMLGQAIGYALDKAIVYGTGKKMPLGIVTRLAQETKPDGYSEKARKWENLSVTNIIKLDLEKSKDTDFWKEMIEKTSAAKENYSNGNMFWVMNRTTKLKLLARTIAFNAAAALTSTMKDEMPILGGEVITLPFMQDGDVLGGFELLYLLAEREGGQFAKSEHVRFIEDQTVFKGTARYDGMPVIAEGYVLMNFLNTDPQKSVEFALDKANTEESRA